jgi:hypothetical protein
MGTIGWRWQLRIYTAGVVRGLTTELVVDLSMYIAVVVFFAS